VIHLLRWTAIAFYTLVLGPPVCLIALFDRSGELPFRIARLWVRMILWTCGVRLEVSGTANVPPGRPLVFMSNHQSSADTAVLLASVPTSVRFMAKRELVRVPIFGWALVLSGHLIVDRGNRTLVLASLQRGIDMIRAGQSLFVFPEGSRSDEGQLSRFKSGGFQMAVVAGVPIVPVSILGSARIAGRGSWGIHSGLVRVSFGEPIPTAGMGSADRPLVKQQVREAILRGLGFCEEPG
jgi:1-acyl-sn-glycerol-3-phosphate acyltransferase